MNSHTFQFNNNNNSIFQEKTKKKWEKCTIQSSTMTSLLLSQNENQFGMHQCIIHQMTEFNAFNGFCGFKLKMSGVHMSYEHEYWTYIILYAAASEPINFWTFISHFTYYVIIIIPMMKMVNMILNEPVSDFSEFWNELFMISPNWIKRTKKPFNFLNECKRLPFTSSFFIFVLNKWEHFECIWSSLWWVRVYDLAIYNVFSSVCR